MNFDNIAAERITELIKGVKSIIEWVNDKIYYNHWFIFLVLIVIITGGSTFFYLGQFPLEYLM